MALNYESCRGNLSAPNFMFACLTEVPILVLQDCDVNSSNRLDSHSSCMHVKEEYDEHFDHNIYSKIR